MKTAGHGQTLNSCPDLLIKKLHPFFSPERSRSLLPLVGFLQNQEHKDLAKEERWYSSLEIKMKLLSGEKDY